MQSIVLKPQLRKSEYQKNNTTTLSEFQLYIWHLVGVFLGGSEL